MWSPSVKQFWLHFFEVYKSHRCLWDVEACEYMNRNKRKKAYEELIQLAKTVNPKADHSFIRARINNVRTAYRKEVRKILRARANGAVYKPKLFYFDLINSFLNHDNNLNLDIKPLTYTEHIGTASDDEDPFASLDSTTNNEYKQIVYSDPNGEDANLDNENNDDSSLADFEPIETEKASLPNKINVIKCAPDDNDDKVVTSLALQTQEKTSTTNSQLQRKNIRQSKKFRKLKIEREDYDDMDDSDFERETPRKIQRTDDDECDILGKRFANHFRNMNPQQRLLAEKIISDVCIYARMDQLTLRSGLTIDIQYDLNAFSQPQPTTQYCEEVIHSEEVDLAPESYIQAL